MGGINQFTKGTIFSFRYDPEYYGGFTTGGNIEFHGQAGRIPYQNYYHEIAHAINNIAGGYFTDKLAAAGIYTANGEYVMGGPPSSYKRNSKGYVADMVFDPVGKEVAAQQHPGSANCSADDDWCITGNTPIEEWGDLIANYLAGNMDNTVFGRTRVNWIVDVWSSYWTSFR